MGMPSVLSGIKGQVLVAVVSSVMTLAVFGSVVFLTGVGFAAPDGDIIHGCVKNGSGLLRIVSDPSDCGRSETAIEWNSEGPQGPPAALTVHWRSTHGVIEAGMWSSVMSYCEPEEVVTGGGYSVGSIGFDDKLHVSGPIDDLATGREGWMVSVFNNTGIDLDVWVTAMCAETAP
jgi:hypothetical protein